MTPFLHNVQNKQVCRDREQTGGCQEMGGRGRKSNCVRSLGCPELMDQNVSAKAAGRQIALPWVQGSSCFFSSPSWTPNFTQGVQKHSYTHS